MNFSRIIFSIIFMASSLMMNAQWTPSTTSLTTPISRTGDLTLGSTTATNSSSVRKLTVNGGTLTYNGTTAITASTGANRYTAQGTSSASLATNFAWSAHGGMRGVVGSVVADQIATNYSNKNALAEAGVFSTTLNDPIPSGRQNSGPYYLTGSRSVLNGTMTNYPGTGIVAAVAGQDNINGAGTWAGYFEGRGHFSGNVGIGTTSPQNALDVCGTVRSNEVKVESGWCDYVFYDDYQLPTLKEEAQHIESKGYLAGFESEAEMNGEINLGDVTKRQQEKIEQMMLHIIKMNERLENLEMENTQLKEAIKK